MIDLIMNSLSRDAATGAKAAIIAKRATTNGNRPQKKTPGHLRQEQEIMQEILKRSRRCKEEEEIQSLSSCSGTKVQVPQGEVQSPGFIS